MNLEFNLGRLIKNTFIYSGGSIISRAVSFFLLPVMTSALTAKDYGILGILAALTQLLTSFFSLGYSVPLSRDYRLYPEKASQHGLIWTTFLFLCLYNLFLLGLGFFAASPLSEKLLGSKENEPLILLSLATLSIIVISGPFNLYLRLEERAFTAFSFSILDLFLSLGFTLYFLKVMQLGVISCLLGPFISQIIGLLFYLLYGLTYLIKKVDLKLLPPLLKQGTPYIFGFAGYFLLTSASRFILEKQTSLSETGLFFMAQNLAKPIDIIIFGFASAWPAYLSRLSLKKEEASEILGPLIEKALIASFALSFPFFAFAKPTTALMLSKEFSNTSSLIGFLALAQSLWGVYLIGSSSFILQKKNFLQVTVEFISGLSSCFFAYFFIPFYGAFGAALATLLGFLFLITATFCFSLKFFPLKIESRPLLKTILPFTIGISLTFFPIEGTAIQIAFGFVLNALFYFFIYQAVKENKEPYLSPVALS